MSLPVYNTSPAPYAGRIEIGYRLKTAVAFRLGWQLYAKHPFLWSFYTLGVVLMVAGPMFIPLLPVNVLVSLTFSAIGLTGFWVGAHAASSGNAVKINDLLQPTGDFGQVVAGHVVSTLGIALGLALILPGIFLISALRFVLPFVFLEKIPFWPAMGLSIKTVRKTLPGWLGFDLLCLLILVAGFALAGVGVLVALPWVMLSRYATYRQVFYPQG